MAALPSPRDPQSPPSGSGDYNSQRPFRKKGAVEVGGGLLPDEASLSPRTLQPVARPERRVFFGGEGRPSSVAAPSPRFPLLEALRKRAPLARPRPAPPYWPALRQPRLPIGGKRRPSSSFPPPTPLLRPRGRRADFPSNRRPPSLEAPPCDPLKGALETGGPLAGLPLDGACVESQALLKAALG